MRAALNNLAEVHDQNQISMSDGGETVGDHEGGATDHEAIERVENNRFGL